MTKIQELVLPIALKKIDILAQAKTGSGKTVAFSIPIVKNLDAKNYKIQALVLAPTRELATQIAVEIRKLSRHIHNIKVLNISGGVPYKPQVNSLLYGAHIVVGTVGRVLKHISEKNINFNDLKYLVLDEADKMLDMGFYDDIMQIIEVLPQNRQTMLFSATYENNTQALATQILKDFKVLKDENSIEIAIKQIFYRVKENEKSNYITSIISQNRANSTLIFCNTKIECEILADKLYDLGLDVLTLHSDFEQRKRDETLILFSNKSYPILIATDVASRGLHIDEIDLVINYDLAKDDKTHTHRIGRTARSGKNGVAVSFFEDSEYDKIEELKVIYENIEICNIDDIKSDISFEIDSIYRTIYIDGGKKQKLRKGDILGSLIVSVGLEKDDIGKIDTLDFCSYVAVKNSRLKKALDGLKKNKIKGKFFRVFEV